MSPVMPNTAPAICCRRLLTYPQGFQKGITEVQYYSRSQKTPTPSNDTFILMAFQGVKLLVQILKIFTLKGQHCKYIGECLIFPLELQHKVDFFAKFILSFCIKKCIIRYQRRTLSIESRYSVIPIAIGLRIDFRQTGMTTTKLSTAGKSATGESTTERRQQQQQWR